MKMQFVTSNLKREGEMYRYRFFKIPSKLSWYLFKLGCSEFKILIATPKVITKGKKKQKRKRRNKNGTHSQCNQT